VLSVNLSEFKILFNSDARLLAMGDSFASYTPSINRVFPAVLMAWPIEEWTAFAGTSNPEVPFATPELLASGPGNGPRKIDFITSYRVESKRNNPKSWFGLPIKSMQEYYLSPTLTLGDDQSFMRFRIIHGRFHFGEYGRFTNAGDELRFRLTFYTTEDLNDQYDRINLRDADDPASLLAADMVLRTRKLWHKGEIPDGSGAIARQGHINAIAPDFRVTQNMGGDPVVWVLDGGDASSATNEGKYFTPANGIFYHVDPATGVRKPGLYYSALADSSWSYHGFGANAPSMASKQYTLEQLTHWLDVTTLDRSQPLRVFYYLAVENGDQAVVKQQMRDMLNQTRLAASMVGISDVQQCLVIPHFHLISSGPNAVEFARQKFDEQRDAAFELAHELSGVAAASIYDATGGVLFDGSQTARDWLVNNGYETFTYGLFTVGLADPNDLNGDLLDEPRLHPRRGGAAAFFAHILGEIIADSQECYADCDPVGPGTLNIFDFICFQDRFFNGDPYADCDGNGVLDIFDFLCFQDAYDAGCP
jgi:hypothetical protein